jgi:hypothetical protein
MLLRMKPPVHSPASACGGATDGRAIAVMERISMDNALGRNALIQNYPHRLSLVQGATRLNPRVWITQTGRDRYLQSLLGLVYYSLIRFEEELIGNLL